MNIQDQEPLLSTDKYEKRLSPKEQVQRVISAKNHVPNRHLIKQIAAELKISFLDCAAAFSYLNGSMPDANAPYKNTGSQDNQNLIVNLPSGVKLVRYRLDIGHNHKVSLELLRKVLVEESGVDVKNIANVRIQDLYTLIDMPDEMPQEVFHHLRDVEMNGQKLDIKRVKSRNKKRGNRKYRRGKSFGTSPVSVT